VLVEGEGKRGPGSQGRTRTNRIVHLGDVVAPGTFAEARIVGAAAHHLSGEVVASAEPVAV
jgi:tRNA A37 methylthiotransferase MiaB